jgi:type VI secretion system protein ImpC
VSPASAQAAPAGEATASAAFGPDALERLLTGIELSGTARRRLVEALDFALPLMNDDLSRTEAAEFGLRLDALVAGLDQVLSRQLDEVLHDPAFMDLERTWRSLKHLVDHADLKENIKISLLDARKAELLCDLTDAPELSRSALYRLVYTAEYGQFGGEPFGALIGAYEMTASPEDLALMRLLCTLGAMAHAPFIASTSCSFLGLRRWSELAGLTDFDSLFRQPRYAAWQALRNFENARYLVLVLPGFLARLPYSPGTNPVSSFNYLEAAVDADRDFVWGFPSLMLALKMAESFARTRFCASLVGLDGGGRIVGLPALEHESMGRVQSRFSLQALVGERLEQKLTEEGFVPISVREAVGSAAFYSAATALRPKSFAADRGGVEATFNHRISTLLPYMMIVNRLAHYIKVIQRENLGTWKDRLVLENELNTWLNRYVTDMDDPSPAIRGKRPLRYAKVEVSDVDGDPGWRRMTLKIKPHLKFMGASFTLSLVGRLDDEKGGASGPPYSSVAAG